MLIVLSIIMSALIVVWGFLQGKHWFGAYRASIDRLTQFAAKLSTCSEGASFMEVATGWVGDQEAATRSLARDLMRHFGKDPITVHGRMGWVVDVDDLCNGKRRFKWHPASVRVESMPGMLTGVGILCTFLGLAVGVFGLDPTDADQLTQGVKKLLGGMSMAFLTSIAGIGTALWWSWRSRETAASLEAVYTLIAEVLHDKHFILMPEEMSHQFLDDMRHQTQALENLEETMTGAFRKALAESVLVEIRDAILQSAGRNEMDQHMGKALKDIHQELKAISQSFAQSTDNQRLMGKALKRILAARDEVAKPEEFDGAAQTRFVSDAVKLTENVKAIHESQGNALAAINESAEQLKKMMKAARLANADIIKVHAALVGHLDKLENHWTNYRGQLEQMQQTLSTTLEGFQGQLGESLQSVHGEFDELLSRGLNHFAGAMKDFQHTLTTLSTVLEMEGEPDVKSKRGGLFGKRNS